MKHAFLIMIHQDLDLVGRIIDRLVAKNHFFYLNIDKKLVVNNVIFDEIAHKSGVRAIIRKKISHGGYSFIKTTNELLIRSIQDDDYDYFHLISGQDYPCVSTFVFDEFFENNTKSYIHLDTMDEIIKYRGDKYLNRLNRFWFFDLMTNNNCYQKFFIRILNKVSEKLFTRKINMDNIWGGWNWMSIHYDLCKFILDYIAYHPEYDSKFKYSYCGDELYWNSIIMNNINLFDVDTFNVLRYVDWHPDRETTSLPLVLNELDYSKIVNSGCFFCRKVNNTESQKLMDMLDKRIFAKI